MAPRDTQIVREYAEAAFRRVRQQTGPVRYLPDSAHRPSRYKTYTSADLIPLPDRPQVAARPLAETYADRSSTTRRRFTIERLAWLLRMSYGVLDRRIRVDWNNDNTTSFPAATWGRGTPSGGGLYPLEIYWVAGAAGPVQRGIYHYATGHNAMERLAGGVFAGQVRSALLGQSHAVRTDHFLLVTARFSRNAFKYGSFGYHLATQDVGALLGSWDLLGAGLGLATRRVLWFDDAVLNRMLGLDTADESVLAVVPLPWSGRQVLPGAGMLEPDEPTTVGAVRLPVFERARNTLRFPLIERVHRATLVDTRRPSRPERARRAATSEADAADRYPSGRRRGRVTPLPPPLTEQMTDPISTLLSRRRSSFGGFLANPPLDLARLATVLAVTSAARYYRCDLKPDSEPVAWTRLSVFANHVSGIPAGCYRYDGAGHVLCGAEPGVPDGLVSDFLRGRHILPNYDLEQVAAMLVISGRLDAMLSSYGPRGYRLLNAEAGTVAQAGYVATTALGVGCGAVLGIDNIAVNEVLGFAGTDERSLLFLLIGWERARRAALDLPLGLWGSA